MNQLDSLYREVILEHQKEPRNFGELTDADIVREGFNPLCGDRVELNVKLSPDQGVISECRFKGEGCSICMASSSMMTEEVCGQSVNHAKACIEKFRGLMQGKVAPQDFAKEYEGDLEALAGVRNFPVRIKCALLAWTTLKDALESQEKGVAQSVSQTEETE